MVLSNKSLTLFSLIKKCICLLFPLSGSFRFEFSYCSFFGDEGKATYREHTQPVKIFTVGPFASICVFITGNIPSSNFLFLSKLIIINEHVYLMQMFCVWVENPLGMFSVGSFPLITLFLYPRSVFSLIVRNFTQ